MVCLHYGFLLIYLSNVSKETKGNTLFCICMKDIIFVVLLC